MILQALVELKGRIDELQGDDAFEEKRVDFVLVLDGAGNLIGVENQRGEDGKGRPMRIPRMPKRTVAVAASFLVDNAKYVLGFDDPEAEKSTKPQRLAAMRAAFSARVVDAAQRTSDAGLLAVQRCYERFDENLERLLRDRPRPEWNGSEMLAFRLIDEVETVHLRPAVARVCSLLRSSSDDPRESDAEEDAKPKKKTAAPQLMRCLVTGVLGRAARLHPSLKRIPGRQSLGRSLVAFNAASFESQGRSQGENAPVSLAAATAYGDVLNWMLAEDPTLGWKRPHRYGVRIGDDAVVLFWAKESREAMDAFALFANPPPTPHEAIAAIESAWKGLASIDDAMPFYALTLGGNAARAVVRDWIETTSCSAIGLPVFTDGEWVETPRPSRVSPGPRVSPSSPTGSGLKLEDRPGLRRGLDGLPVFTDGEWVETITGWSFARSAARLPVFTDGEWVETP